MFTQENEHGFDTTLSWQSRIFIPRHFLTMNPTLYIYLFLFLFLKGTVCQQKDILKHKFNSLQNTCFCLLLHKGVNVQRRKQ